MKFGNTIVPVFSSTSTGGVRYVANTANSSPGNGTGVYTAAASLLTPFVFCFLSGTSISTPHGSVPIQDLEVGQLIHTNNGPKPVRFVSRSAYQPYMLDLCESLPIRIQACALGEGLPCEDLYVSGDHAILVEEHLVHASALVNGATISRTSIDDWEPSHSIVYYNIELDEHMIIEANGLKAESFIDNAPRKTWDNYEEYQALYGEERSIQEMSLPRVKFARQLGSSLRLTLRHNALTRGLPKKERELAAV
ncbi:MULTISPECIES: Hint domain-containing protein [unclassified Synechococcus]|uniref:Hint domain-containing protein n=1 Tax=unclassified Synechococcus TaxID=2626047 RepID=UPI0018DC5657|nr:MULTISPECIES: Hint domain-containing protein [unclassified Synechococcus]WFN58359.1 Hint domain-containing protein [Synechococcus sp. CCFWC 502]